jgi:DNA-binding transcriptional LysR family regulator
MQIHDIEDVIAIAETGSFSKAAADRVFITQSALSQGIKKLEDELGVKLFDRSTSPVRPTREGKVFIEEGYKVLRAFNDIPKKIADMRELRKGRLSIGVTQFYSRGHFPRVLYRFKQAYPGIEVRIVEEGSSILEELLENGKLDFSFFSLPIKSANIAWEKIFNEDILFAVPRNHPVNKQFKNADKRGMQTVDLAQFKNDNFIIEREGQRLRTIAMDLCRKAGFEPKVTVETRNVNALNGFILAGMGVGFVTKSVWDILRPRDRAVYYHLKGSPARTFAAACCANSYLPRAAKAFIRLAKEDAAKLS